MSLKIKSTLNFVKLWPLDDRREEFSIHVISSTKEDSNNDSSQVIDQTICIERDEQNRIVYQVYLKSTAYEKSYIASKFNPTVKDDELSSSMMFQYIIENKLRLVPTELSWITEDGEPALFVTHDVYRGKERFQGMSVSDIINSMVNGKEVAV